MILQIIHQYPQHLLLISIKNVINYWHKNYSYPFVIFMFFGKIKCVSMITSLHKEKKNDLIFYTYKNSEKRRNYLTTNTNCSLNFEQTRITLQIDSMRIRNNTDSQVFCNFITFTNRSSFATSFNFATQFNNCRKSQFEKMGKTTTIMLPMLYDQHLRNLTCKHI